MARPEGPEPDATRAGRRPRREGRRREEQKPPAYTAAIENWDNVGDDPTNMHIEYCVLVTHRGGFQWRVWRRFSDFNHLHHALASNLGESGFQLPAPPQKSFIPSSLQGISSVFCDHRHRELQDYLAEVLRDPAVSEHAVVQQFLGVQPPEQPEGLRLLARPGGHELEVRPGLDAEAAPVDGYIIEICHIEESQVHEITRDVGCAGKQLQKAQIGRLQPGKHMFSVFAYNLAGRSHDPASITVDTLPQAPLALDTEQRPASPPPPVPDALPLPPQAATPEAPRDATARGRPGGG